MHAPVAIMSASRLVAKIQPGELVLQKREQVSFAVGMREAEHGEWTGACRIGLLPSFPPGGRSAVPVCRCPHYPDTSTHHLARFVFLYHYYAYYTYTFLFERERNYTVPLVAVGGYANNLRW